MIDKNKQTNKYRIIYYQFKKIIQQYQRSYLLIIDELIYSNNRTVADIGNLQFIMIQMNSKIDQYQDLLYLQAKRLLQSNKPIQNQYGLLSFKSTLQLSKTITQTKFYILICAYYLKQPSHLTLYIKYVMADSAFNLSLFLQTLRSLSLFYMDNNQMYKLVKNVYMGIYEIGLAKIRMIGQCHMTEEIQQMIESIKDGQGNCLKQGKIRSIKNQLTNSFDCQIVKNVGYIKMSLLISEVKADMNVSQRQAIWNQMIDLIGLNDLDVMKVFFISTQKMLQKQFYEHFFFLLYKFIDKVGLDTLLLLLIGKLHSENQQNGQTIVQLGSICQVIENYRYKQEKWQNPLKLTIQTLALMIKAGIIEYGSISQQLTPSTSFLIDFSDNRVNLHLFLFEKCNQKDLSRSTLENNIGIWGQLIFSSKLQLMTQLILLNCYKQFKFILQKQKIKLDLIYHPPLIHALSLLIQWIIHPLYQIISPAQFFKQKSIVTLSFPRGTFLQCFTVSNYFIELIFEILNTAKYYVLTNRSTFVKLCRIFSIICSKRNELPIQQSDVGNKIIIFIHNVIKQYLLPSLQFYHHDPTVSYQLHCLIDLFLFKTQIDIFYDCLKQRQLANLHLCYIFHQTSKAQYEYSNLIEDSKGKIGVRKMGLLMNSRTFSSLNFIFKRLIMNWNGSQQFFVAAIVSAPVLTRKIAFFYILMYLSQNQQNQQLVKSDGLITTMYANLINVTQMLLVAQNRNIEYLKIFLQYFCFKIKPKNNTRQVSSFQLFHGQLNMLTTICHNLLVCDIAGNIYHTNRFSLSAGPYLKIAIMNKIDQFYRNKCIRKNMVKLMLAESEQNIKGSLFYKVILSLSAQLNSILVNQKLTPKIVGYLHDQIYKLIVCFINIVHFETTLKDCEWLVSTDRFKQLVDQYSFPYQLAFHIARNSIFNKICRGAQNMIQEPTWNHYKEQFIGPLLSHLCQKSAKMQQTCKFIKKQYFSSKQIKQFITRDVFLLFWIQNSQSALSTDIYKDHLKQLEHKAQQDQVRKRMIELFHSQLTKEQAKNKLANHMFRFGKDSQQKIISQTYINRLKVAELKPQNVHMKMELKLFMQMFMKYCIIRRSFISKGDAYYGSLFLFNLFRINLTPILTILQCITYSMQYIISYLPFSTERQSTQILPILFSSITSLMHYWCSRNKLNERLFRFRMIKEGVDFNTYEKIQYLLYQCNQIILGRIVMISQDEFAVKNCLQFILKTKYFPFCSQHIVGFLKYLQDLQTAFKNQSDMIKKIELIKKEINSKDEKGFIKPMKNSIIKKYKARNSPVSASVEQITLLDESKQIQSNSKLISHPNHNYSYSIDKDPLNYPSLSDTFQGNYDVDPTQYKQIVAEPQNKNIGKIGKNNNLNLQFNQGQQSDQMDIQNRNSNNLINIEKKKRKIIKKYFPQKNTSDL